jgi:hypothetical protein
MAVLPIRWQAEHILHLMASAQGQRTQLVLAQDAMANPWQFMGERQMNYIKQKALVLLNEVLEKRGLERRQHIDLLMPTEEALCRAVELLEQEKAMHAERLLAMDARTTKAETQREAAEQELANFRQEVSDAVQSWVDGGIDRPAYLWFRKNLEQFIIPKPKPDPLVEAFDAVCPGIDRTMVKAIRAVLDAAGFEIKEKNDG